MTKTQNKQNVFILPQKNNGANGKLSKNILDQALVYLGGPMDDAKDNGVGWRRHFIEGLKKSGINLIVLDPTNKVPSLSPETHIEKETHMRLKKNHQWAKLSRFVKKIVRCDLRQIDFCDFLVVKVDKNIHMCGSYFEVQIADLQRKPILAIIEGGKENAPSWLFGILDYNLMFDSEEECLRYLDKINRGKIKPSSRWILIRKKIKGILTKA